MKYTLKTIKKTKVYQANIEAVRAVFPGHEEDFARELMIAANSLKERGLIFRASEPRLVAAFGWVHTPQGDAPWWELNRHLERFKRDKEQNKND